MVIGFAILFGALTVNFAVAWKVMTLMRIPHEEAQDNFTVCFCATSLFATIWSFQTLGLFAGTLAATTAFAFTAAVVRFWISTTDPIKQ